MKLVHKCVCPEHAFDRKLFDDLPGVIDRTLAGIASASHRHPTAPSIYITMDSKDEAPEAWLSFRSVEHAWHPSLVNRFKLHPVIDAMLAYRPANITQLALEWPHIADSDGEKLAYTRDDAKGHADIQTLTSTATAGPAGPSRPPKHAHCRCPQHKPGAWLATATRAK